MNKKIVVIIILIIIGMSIIPIKSNAVVPIDSAYIYANKKTDGLLMWNGLKIHAHLAVYQKDSREYPAYCLNRDLPGVEIGVSQTVTINELVNNVMVWRAIINGYPYKTISELGCYSEEEAYLATKQAVYCMLTNRDVNEYTAIGEAGERTLNALKQIVSNARNSNEVKVSSEISITQRNSLWTIDKNDNKYISQYFTINANSNIDTYKIQLENINVEGIKITDENNNEKTEFNFNEEFKILIPITNITQDGNFTINVSGKVATKPVLYGKSQSSSLQDYAITGYTYEDGTGSKKIYYTKNETKIIIIKKAGKTETKLEGVEFELLDINKNVLYTGLKTNKDGQTEINNLLPGIYYIKETRTLEGYQLYDKLIKVDLDLNEAITVNVLNSEDKPNIEVETKASEITVEEKEEKTIVKLPKTGM
ncbi:MAG: SpaA isopeptide-forming pilin-related protein [Clostridia bacterium]|nr:SpaA isopeptide-forming pilin-related protein [Clostridia bacterium]